MTQTDFWGLAGRTAIVTGTGGKIGAQIAVKLIEAGCRVALLEKSEERARKLHPPIAALGETHEELMDVGNPDAWRAAIPRIVHAIGEPTLLINNAAMPCREVIANISDATAMQVLQTNLLASFYAVRGLEPYWKKIRRGAVVNISSIHAMRGYGKYSIYAASKAGLEAAMRDWAFEFGECNVRFNAVSPGDIDSYFDTEAWLQENVHPSYHAEFREKFGSPGHPVYQNWQPLRTVGSPEHVADATLFLLSERARFITGHTLVVDGGATLVMGYRNPRLKQQQRETAELNDWVQKHAPDKQP